MQRSIAVATSILVLALAGCSMHSMEKRWDKMTGKSDKEETRIDLNQAGHKKLASLPGLTGADADRIIANRPYANRRELVKKNVLTEAQFNRIRDQVYVDHDKD